MIEKAQNELRAAAEQLSIPEADYYEAIDTMTDFIYKIPLTEENRNYYWLLMGVQAYSSGKKAAE